MFEDIGMLITQEIGRTAIPLGEIALRLGLAALLAGILGLEREVRGRAAGLRTHMLVSLAAATFTVGALELLYWAEELDKGVAQIDPARALEAITAGVAFLAAGTI
ncbi:MAG TPA: MgtC/SapB family protein, partial [Alphaproteobacteria bacterium]|nr:MgtC/SapB family protein [Alphaproteobacteria bacterium]